MAAPRTNSWSPFSAVRSRRALTNRLIRIKEVSPLNPFWVFYKESLSLAIFHLKQILKLLEAPLALFEFCLGCRTVENRVPAAGSPQMELWSWRRTLLLVLQVYWLLADDLKCVVQDIRCFSFYVSGVHPTWAERGGVEVDFEWGDVLDGCELGLWVEFRGGGFFGGDRVNVWCFESWDFRN